MADKSHIYRLTVTLSDVTRSVYAELPIIAARHPSETVEYLAVRILAYILHWQEGIRFGRGICIGDEPAVYIEDTGRYTLWVEIGLPDSKRAVKASHSAEQVVVCILIAANLRKNWKTSRGFPTWPCIVSSRKRFLQSLNGLKQKPGT